jgi:hypothetical protein
LADHLKCNVSVTDAMASSASTSSYSNTERSCLCGSVNAPSVSPPQHVSNTAKCKICRTKPKFCFLRGQRSFDLGQQGPSSAGEFVASVRHQHFSLFNVIFPSIVLCLLTPCSFFPSLSISSNLHVSLPSLKIPSFSSYVLSCEKVRCSPTTLKLLPSKECG